MRVYDMLKKDSPYQKDDMVEGIVYDTSDNFGLFVAVDNQYSALIPKKEVYGKLRIGQTVKARVTACLLYTSLNGSILNSSPLFRVPSGKMQIEIPFFTYSIA